MGVSGSVSVKYWQQIIFPKHILSRVLGKLANAKLGCLTRFGIKKFIAHYRVNLQDAKITDYKQFETFNDFFTRELKTGARFVSQEKNSVVSPVDGCVSECGDILEDKLLQAKNAYFNLQDLCGGDLATSEHFINGKFLTAYLSPKDYHRFHMPMTGKLKKMIYIPGKLFSVNHSSVQNVPGLFARNERVICLFETEIGHVALIAVGAMIVGSIAMNWHGVVAPGKQKTVWQYESENIILQRGDEVGHFRLGSTVIILCEKNSVQWMDLVQANSVLRLGEVIAREHIH